MDELVVSGKKYISSKRASELTGYAKDYIGQLARSGKVAATRFGRAWYVEEAALLAHAQTEPKPAEENQPVGPLQRVQSPIQAVPSNFYKPYAFPQTWSKVRYLEDNSELLPTLSKREPEVVFNTSEISQPIRTHSASTTVLEPSVTPIQIKVQRNPVMSPIQPINRSFDLVKENTVRTEVTFKTEEKHYPERKREKKRRQTGIFPIAAMSFSLGLFILLGSGFFFSSETTYIPVNDAYTASVIGSFDHIQTILNNSPVIQGGVSAVGSFFGTIGSSFWSFFQSGVNFFKTL